MRIVLCLVVAVALTALRADGAKLALKDASSAEKGEGSTDWANTVQKLLAFLPDDSDWKDSIDALLSSYKEEAINVCSLKGLGCNKAHEVDTLHIEDAKGRLMWDALPSSAAFVVLTGGQFTDPFPSSLPHFVQSVQFYSSTFGEGSGQVPAADRDRQRSRLQEIVCNGCGLKRVHLDNYPSLTSLQLAQNSLHGFSLSALPSALRTLNLSFACVDLSPKLASLPASLTSVDLSGNGIEDLADGAIPGLVEELSLSANRLSGRIPVSVLPMGLRRLDLAGNHLTGELGGLASFSKLVHINLSDNQVSGIDFSTLPSGVEDVILARNKLHGELDFTRLPSDLRIIDVSFNEIGGRLDLTKLPGNIDTINAQGNKFTGPVDFKHFPASTRFVYVQQNRLTGRPDVSRLPLDLRRIFFGDNNWDSLLPPK